MTFKLTDYVQVTNLFSAYTQVILKRDWPFFWCFVATWEKPEIKIAVNEEENIADLYQISSDFL